MAKPCLENHINGLHMPIGWQEKQLLPLDSITLFQYRYANIKPKTGKALPREFYSTKTTACYLRSLIITMVRVSLPL